MRGIASRQQVNLDLSSYARFDQILNSQSPALIMSSSGLMLTLREFARIGVRQIFPELKTSDLVYALIPEINALFPIIGFFSRIRNAAPTPVPAAAGDHNVVWSEPVGQ